MYDRDYAVFAIIVLLFYLALISVYLLLCRRVGRYWRTSRGRGFWGGFWLSVATTPLVGWVVGALLQANGEALSKQAVEAGTMKVCPFCAEHIKIEAILCRYCGKEVPAEPAPKATKQVLRPTVAPPVRPAEKFCASCDTKVDATATVCPNCRCGAFSHTPAG